MCSINGFIRFSGLGDFDIIKEEIKKIIITGESRGKDSFGYCLIDQNSLITNQYKYIDRPSHILNNEFFLYPNTKILLNNNRAEPTTEFIEHKTINDVQPFRSKSVVIVHNGIIANDKDLRKDYNITTDTSIDSSVIPFLFEGIGKYDYDKYIDIFQNKLIGSYSLAIYNIETATLILATNYKPLSLKFDAKNDILYFSSLEDFIHDSSNYNNLFGGESFKEVAPYTMLVIHADTKKIKSFDLYKEPINNPKKALVMASSGLDSTVAATWAKAQNYDVTLLHFQYKCRAESKEWEAINNISKELNCQLITMPLDFFKTTVGGSRLTESNSDIIKEGDKGAELAYEWVPARNLVFMSIAAAIAESRSIDYIILGGNLEESGAYSDNELIFQKKFNDILPYSLNLQHKVQVLTPVANLMKRDIVELGLKLNAPLHLTWSCYEPGEKHCGKCGPCFMRRTAFKMIGEPEVIEYLDEK